MQRVNSRGIALRVIGLTTKLSYPNPMIKLWSDVGGEAGRSCEGGHEAARSYLQHLVGPIFSNFAHE